MEKENRRRESAARAVGSKNDHTATCNSPSRRTKRVRAVSATTVLKHGVEGATLGGVSKKVRAVSATTVEKHGVEGATLGGVSKKFRKYSVGGGLSKQPEAKPREGRESFTVMCINEVDGALCGNLRQTSAITSVRCSQGSKLCGRKKHQSWLRVVPSSSPTANYPRVELQLVSMDNASRMGFYFSQCA